MGGSLEAHETSHFESSSSFMVSVELPIESHSS